jgi:hypothetical protein
LSASALQAQAPILRGIVLDDTGKPVKQAIVADVGASTREVTDDLGHFSLRLNPTLRAGDTLRVRVEKSGFRESDTEVVVAGAADFVLKIHLIPIRRADNLAQASGDMLPSEAMGIARAQVVMVMAHESCGGGIIVGTDDRTVYIATAADLIGNGKRARV